MALIKCSKCGNMVSDKASSCPSVALSSSRMEYHATEKKSNIKRLSHTKTIHLRIVVLCLIRKTK